MDEGTPNPNKPRLSRRLLSHFTLTLSVLLALSFVVLALGSSTQDASAWGIEEIAVVGANAAAGAGIGAMVGDGIGAMVGAAAGAFVGLFLLGANGEKTSMALDGAAQMDFANGMATVYNNYLNLANDQTQNCITLFNMTTYYLVRKAEYAAKELFDHQKAHGLSHTYNADYVMARSEVANTTTSFMWAMLQEYNSIWQNYGNLVDNFVGTYAGMSTYAAANYYSGYGGQAWITKTIPYMCYRLPNTAYLSPNSTVFVVLDEPTNNAEGTLTMTLKNATGATVYSADYGSLVNQGFMAPIDYQFNSTDKYTVTFGGTKASQAHIYGYGCKAPTSTGELIPAVLTLASNPDGGLMLGQSVMAAYWQYQTDSVSIRFGGGPSSGEWKQPSQPYPAYKIRTSGGSLSNGINVQEALVLMNQLGIRSNQMITTVNAFAQSYYNLCVANGGSTGLVLPDLLFPDPIEMEDYTWEQIYTIVLAYLAQMESWYENHSVMDLRNVNITAESLKLLCRGAIWDSEGHQLYNESAIWSPLVTLDDMVLNAGPDGVNNSLTQPGFAIVWGYADSLANFRSTNRAEYVELSQNYNLTIYEMQYDGVVVTTHKLTLTNVQFVVRGVDGNPTYPQGLNDVDWLIAHWYYFAIVAGVICMLAAISLRNAAVILVGVVLLAAGGIGYWMAGDFSLLDGLGLSMEPPNLRAWLQQLR